MIDRVVAAAAGMAAALYVMAASVAWCRVILPTPSHSFAKRVMLDRAVAWSALAAIFLVVVAVKLSVADWTDAGVDLVLAVASLAIFVAGLVSVRAITMAAFGNRVLVVFAMVSIAVGLLILLA
jgi:predicted tellurium resistance membrane protein TerC